MFTKSKNFNKDYHVHSGMLKHTDDNLEDIVKAARDLGFEEIAFTEHLIWIFIANPEIDYLKERDTLYPEKGMIPKDTKTTDLDSYFKKIENCQKKYKIKLLKGLEIDYFEEYENEIKECLSKYDIEIKLGSNHFLSYSERDSSKNIYFKVGDKEQIESFIKKYGEQELYIKYFDNMLKAVESNVFDYIAHLDYIKKGFKHYNFNRAEPYIDKILECMIKNDVGLEINLSGIKKVGETFPSKEVIDKYKKMGGRKISIGSDAHSISRLKKMAPIVGDFWRIYGYTNKYK